MPNMRSKQIKVFWFFFSKKNCFPGAYLPLAMSRPQGGLAKKAGIAKWATGQDFYTCHVKTVDGEAGVVKSAFPQSARSEVSDDNAAMSRITAPQ
jgi:hypothetical protein